MATKCLQTFKMGSQTESSSNGDEVVISFVEMVDSYDAVQNVMNEGFIC